MYTTAFYHYYIFEGKTYVSMDHIIYKKNLIVKTIHIYTQITVINTITLYPVPLSAGVTT